MSPQPPLDPDEPVIPSDGYDLPPDLPDEPGGPLEPDEPTLEERPHRGGGGSGGALKAALAIGLVVLVAGALLAYRAHHRKRVVGEGIARAESLIRLDTAAGYRDAAAALEPLAEMDPIRAGSVRAFALGMLFADYRDTAAEDAAEVLLVEPGRAEEVPPWASLAYAALALGKSEAGNAATAAARAGNVPWAHALQARVALTAGNLDAGAEPAAIAAAADLPAGLAIQGDLLRRTRKDLAGARAAYEAALAASPTHARSAFGLAKLSLSGHGDAGKARAALERLLDDRTGTAGVERGRAAVFLSALALRAGEAGPYHALDRAGLTGPVRTWAERAARAASENRGPYRAVLGAPPPLQSASDDDPADLPPWSPPPPPPPQRAAAVKKPVRAAVRPSAKPPARKAPAKKAPARTTRKTRR